MHETGQSAKLCHGTLCACRMRGTPQNPLRVSKGFLVEKVGVKAALSCKSTYIWCKGLLTQNGVAVKKYCRRSLCVKDFKCKGCLAETLVGVNAV